MINNSWQNPFPRTGDKFFDRNHDGKLDVIESSFRDAHIREMSENTGETPNNQIPRRKQPFNPSAGMRAGTIIWICIILIICILIWRL